jgi:hypothetical protein
MNKGIYSIVTMFNHILSATMIALCIATAAGAGPEKRMVDGVDYHILLAPADAVRIL